MSIKEVVHGALKKGPDIMPTGAANAYAGITQIASGSASVTVSTTTVKSDSIIMPTLQSLTNTSSGFGPSVEVRSIVDGGYFILSHADGKAQARDVNVHWVLMQTKV